MKEIKTVVIIGLGALGVIYADKLAKTPGVNLYILVDKDRKIRYEQNGINYNGNRLNFNYILPENTDVKADLVIVAVKSNGLASAIDMLANVIHNETIILSLLNGVSSERLIGEQYGAELVLPTVYLAHGSTNIDNVITHDGVNHIYFGEVSGEITDRILCCKELFDKAKIAYTVPDDILYEVWRKFMIIIGFNQSSVLFDSDFSIFYAVNDTVFFAEKLIREVAAIAQRLGIGNTEQMIQSALETGSRGFQPTMKASIYQDYLMKRPMEVDIFSGEVCRLGRELGIATPYNDVMQDVLTILNKKNYHTLQQISK